MTPSDRRRNRVAVIDIGSNSIKLLVAERTAPNRPLTVLREATEETRIGAGISRSIPELLESGITPGLQAVRRLHDVACTHDPGEIALTATSAVRDAVNRAEFAKRLEADLGLPLRILTGREEARFIALGIRCDPDLQDLTDFYLFDLGGGSLETLAIEEDHLRHVDSLPLGCVRLTEVFVPDREAPFSKMQQEQVANHVRSVLQNARFAFDLAANTRTVITGGTAAIARLLAPSDESTHPSRVNRQQLDQILQDISPLPLERRRRYPGLPPSRADVFPVALVTLMTVLDMGRIGEFQHSFCNLRYGVAWEMLSAD
ncbi:MAG: phosphatase [Opitutaceae bacterium]